MDKIILNMTWIFILIFLYKECNANVVEVQEDGTATINCPLSGNIQYPTWTGPGRLDNPLTVGQTIKEPGFEWVNNKDLKLDNAMLKHDGNYTCTGDDGNTGVAELDVQYFSPSASITTASIENTTAVFTCEVHSNPTSKIYPHVSLRHNYELGENATKTSSTFYPCLPDPRKQNRTRCSFVAVVHLSKEDNGNKMNCEFEYKNRTEVTLYASVQFQFPPTKVTITGNRSITDSTQKTLKLTCSTDASNPVSAVVWRKGQEKEASENTIIRSTHPSVTMDAEFNGKNITQAIDIDVDETTSKETIFCCAQHNYKELCTSTVLKYDVSSASSVVPRLMSPFLVAWATLHII